MAWKGLDVAFVRPAQDEADVRMGDEPTRTVQHEGEAGFSHFDGRYYVPNQFEVDLGDYGCRRRPVAGNRNHQVWLGASVIAHVAKPDPGRAGANYRGIGGSVSAAVYSIEADTRDIKAFSPPMVEECETHDGRGLAKQAHCVSPPPLVGILSPGKLDQPAKLVRDAVDEAMDLGCGGRRLNAEQLIKSRTLVAIAEPGFDDTADRERNRHGHKKHEQVLLEKAAKMLPDYHASAPQSDSDTTTREQIQVGKPLKPSIFPPHHSIGLQSGLFGQRTLTQRYAVRSENGPKANIGRRLNQVLMYAAKMDHRPIVSRAGRRCAAGYFLCSDRPPD